ncbi:transcriptional regulator [Myroides pelagicus]|uniref:Transcriptional regulator n=2 Tax=Myroides pelagicus TaxID=270914 RepID=A0A7K1GIP5_9FLAO|nr:helix-turn-helix domain-containing protein [Myroides pelagicus]MTH28333.1 transcriptional regulator [Myroides pelagicus]
MCAYKSKDIYESYSVRLALDILSKSWNAWILMELELGPLGLSELHRLIEVAPRRVLTKQIGELEQAGLLTKQVFPEVPLRVEYSLSSRGQELVYIIKQLKLWSNKYKKDLIAIMVD